MFAAAACTEAAPIGGYYRPGWGVGAAAAGAAVGAAATGAYYNNTYNNAQCGYYPYPPCY